MKKVFILALFLCFAIGLNAQVAKTVEVIKAGSLSALLTQDELASVAALTLTGTIDARDFKTMRDNMPALTFLDMKGVIIHSFQGPGGTDLDDPDNLIYYSENTIPLYAFADKQLKSVLLPFSVTAIQQNAFGDCSLLTDFTIPPMVSFIGFKAFYYCNHLKTFHVDASVPPDLDIPQQFYPYKETVFTAETKSFCTLHVPYGTKARYSAAFGWKDFAVIEEAAFGFNLALSSVIFDAGQNTTTINLEGNVSWTAVSDQPWLTVTPETGTDSETLTLTAAVNTTILQRKALVTVSADGISPQQIVVTQDGQTKNITITAGSLSHALTTKEFKGVSNLTVKGTMDARDFLILRDSMPLLSVLDISEVKVEAWSLDYTLCKANEIPPSAFEAWGYLHRPLLLRSVLLPFNITSIGQSAFLNCDLLESVSIPASVTTISTFAFQGCYGLKAVYMNSIHPIDLSDFENWYVFSNNRITCTLHVPYGAAPLYSQAWEWKDFGQIIEGTEGFIVYPKKVLIGGDEGSVAMAPVKSSIPLNITSDQEWLKVNPVMEAGDKALTLMARANPLETARRASVTVSAIGYESQTIEVWQYGIGTAVDGLEENNPLLSCYPNPFNSQMNIEASNPSHREVTVDIFSISGQKIKTLAKALKGANISLQWEGDDEQGRQVPPGMYLVKMDGKTMKVVRK